MKLMFKLASCAVAGLLLAGCGRKEARPSLDGRWTGYDLARPGVTCTLTVSGDAVDYRGAGSNDWCRASFTLNDKVQPARIDLTFQASSAPELVGKSTLGIYLLQGDQFSLWISDPGSNKRPETMASGPHVQAFSFKRE